MIRRFVFVVLWLLVGSAALGAVYYGLLNVPESTVWMLALSALLAVVIVVGALVVHSAALLALFPDIAMSRSLILALRRFVYAVPAVLLFGIFWWVTGRLDTWHVANQGPIDASLMVHFNWRNPTWVHRSLDWAIWLLRYVLGGSLAVACAATGLREGFAAIFRFRWALRGLDPRALLVVLATELLFFVWPWRYLYWRPKGLPPTSAELTFVVSKLALFALLFAMGWSALLSAAAWRWSRDHPAADGR